MYRFANYSDAYIDNFKNIVLILNVSPLEFDLQR